MGHPEFVGRTGIYISGFQPLGCCGVRDPGLRFAPTWAGISRAVGPQGKGAAPTCDLGWYVSGRWPVTQRRCPYVRPGLFPTHAPNARA
jgi:hypothetical protein